MDTNFSVDDVVAEELVDIRGGLYYSEKQRLKAGEYQSVASAVARRTQYLAVTIVLWVCGYVAVGMWQLADAVREGSMSGMAIGIGWMLLALGSGGAMGYYYVRVKTKLETINRLLRRQDVDRAPSTGSMSADNKFV